VDLHLGNTEQAYQYLKTAFRLGHDESSLLFYLARTLRLKGSGGAAEHLLHKLLDRNKNDVGALAELGKLKMEEKKFHKAIDLFDQALVVSGNAPPLHNNIGVCFLRLGDRERAAEHFEKALKIDPQYLPAHRNLQMLLDATIDDSSLESTVL
jgi:type IV pilus assembly protein PilF